MKVETLQLIELQFKEVFKEVREIIDILDLEYQRIVSHISYAIFFDLLASQEKDYTISKNRLIFDSLWSEIHVISFKNLALH